MKRLIGIIILFLIIFVGNIYSQDYDVMWKRVKEYEEKDLPQSVVKESLNIFKLAKHRKNSGEMMKSYLTAMQYRNIISDDSLKVDINYIDKWARESNSIDEKAILYSILASITIDKNSKEGFDYIMLSLENKNRLFNTSVDKYLPIIKKGKFSSKYYNNSLYSLICLRAIDLFKISILNDKQFSNIDSNINNLDDFLSYKIEPISKYDSKAQILILYQSMIKKYYNEKHYDSWQLISLDALEFLHSYYPLNFTDSVYYSTLNRWINNSDSIQSVGAVYEALSRYYLDNDNPLKALETVRNGIKRVPDYLGINNLYNIENIIMCPSLNVDIPTLYPKVKDSLSVSSKNIKSVTLFIYKLNLSVTSNLLRSDKYDEMILKYGKLENRLEYKLKAESDYKVHNTLIPVTVNNSGIYCVEIIPDNKKSKAKKCVIYVSSLKVLNRALPNDKSEFVVVNAKDGHPVPYSLLNIYSLKNNSYQLMNKYNTNNKGVVQLDSCDNMLYNASYPGDNSMEIVYGLKNYYGRNISEKENEYVRIFTDRSLYKPGQTVYLGGFVYSQLNDSTKIIANKSLKVTLYDANNNAISSKELITDNFGSFGAEFILPENILTGNFSLRVGNERTSFKVEEYKRPTFNVKFMPYKQSYGANDTIIVKGIVKTFTGIPLANQKVVYNIKRRFLWNFSKYTNMQNGVVSTNKDGEFSIPLYFDVKENEEINYRWYYNFIVNADVVNTSGETQSASLSLPLSSSSLKLDIDGISGFIMKEKKDSLYFSVKNLDSNNITTKVGYKIFQYSKDFKDSILVLNSEIKSNISFIPHKFYLLKSGCYKIEAVVTDANGKKIVESKDFTLFSKKDKSPFYYCEDWFYQSASDFNNGKRVDVSVGSSMKDVYMFYDVYSGNKILESKVFEFTDSILNFSYSYNKEYGDGVFISFIFVKNGQLFSHYIRLEKPKPDKHLIMRWSTFRDKLIPGDKEEWKLKVSYPNGKPADASLIATMYDASLNEIYNHSWNFNLYFNRFIPSSKWSMKGESNASLDFYFSCKDIVLVNKYNQLEIPSFRKYSLANKMYSRGQMLLSNNMAEDVAEDGMTSYQEVSIHNDNLKEFDNHIISDNSDSFRYDFSETAFFYPFLKTDNKGEATISFTLPESITTWDFISLAYTKDVDYSFLKSRIIARKEFMVQPNIPRFVREGDDTEISSMIMNLSNKDINGTIKMQLFNPLTDEVINQQEKQFEVKASDNTNINFSFNINEKISFFACRIIAEGDGFSDGEQQIIPVLSNKQWITESLPINIIDKGSYKYDINKLFNNDSKSATNKRLTIEYSSNPIWYAIQALPVMSNSQNDNSYSLAAAFYANYLSKYIVDSNPKLKDILQKWDKGLGGDKDRFISDLEKNKELKNIILKETPWVVEAENEEEQKKRLSTLFDLNTLKYRNDVIIDKLENIQNGDGSWSWYTGMQGSRFITTNIVELLARLKYKTNKQLPDYVRSMYDNALSYLSEEVESEYKEALKDKSERRYVPNYIMQYLYICAIDSSINSDKTINDYFINKITKDPTKLNIYQKALSSFILYKNNRYDLASEYLESIMQYSLYNKQYGRYFDSNKAPSSSQSYKIETEVAAIEAIKLIMPNSPSIDEMKQWLLSQKQVQQWSTPIATVNAIYALIPEESDISFEGDKSISIMVNNKELSTSNNIEGYLKKNIDENVSSIRNITFNKSNIGMGWGAIYAQYNENLSKIKSYSKGLNIAKSLYRNGELMNDSTIFSVGDKVTIRLFISSDKDFDFVNIKDGMAACMQPQEDLSGYRWNSNISYYQSVDNASMSFFVDKMSKGKYVIEYNVFINRPGIYRTGISSIQSAYAPEYGGVEKSIKLIVK